MVSICKRKERYKTIRFQENANRKIRDYKINEFLKFLKLLHKDSHIIELKKKKTSCESTQHWFDVLLVTHTWFLLFTQVLGPREGNNQEMTLYCLQ